MSAWRQAGLNYINYSQIAAKLLRQALKADLRVEALKRDESAIKFTQWKDGKPITEKY
ncbi:protein stunted isoform X1 [Cephus cinctus]|uniref:Protein stunted isoform X1 n=1 Tax=Cephus cinctus TaxID=211228 RepID=A0AAJ7BHB4_CEPCN|nr:protein stunted isoform X1 [Cephus cinctus]